MRFDKLKVYLLEIILIVFIIITLLNPNIITRGVLSIFLAIYTVMSYFLLRKRNVTSIYEKDCAYILIGLGIMGVFILYFIGIFSGFYVSSVKFGLFGIKSYIIPLTIIIIASEVLRFIFLSQEGKVTSALCFIALLGIDLAYYLPAYDLTNLQGFLTGLGIVLFASASRNLLFNYISKRYSYKGIIGYRLITTLYPYIIPITPDIYDYFKAIMQILYPYIIYVIIDITFRKNVHAVKKTNKVREILSYAVLMVIVVGISMLISGKFKYSILVIGSGSMSGTIDKGDAIIYEAYKKQSLKEGDIIVFKKDNIQVIHRIVDIKKINNQVRYYTKGDNNVSMDEEYRTNSDIVGIYKFRIPKIGYPTINLKERFSN